MKMHGLTTFAGLTAALIFSAPALAEGEQGYGATDPTIQQSQSFDALDQNQDGELTYEEARDQEALTEEWDSYDADESGTVDRAEFSAFEEEHQDDAGVENKSGKVDNPTQRWQEMDEKDPSRMAE